MTLFDVDKNSVDRGSPNPSRHDQIIDGAVKNHATHSINPISDATTQTGFISQKNQQVIAYDGTANKALMGYNSALNKWGFFVADDGVDVTTNSDPGQLIFNSSQDVFKIVASGTTTIPTSGTSSSQVSIAHGLSTIPFLMASALVSGNYNPFPVLGVNDTTGVILGYYTCWADATNVYFRAAAPGSTVSSATPVKYYILQETAN